MKPKGRTRKEGAMTVAMIVKGMPVELRQQVKAAAALQGVTMSQFIQDALRAALAKKGGR